MAPPRRDRSRDANPVGKHTILEPVKAAIGPWNFAYISPKQALAL
jgi:hypothetical protein